MNGLAIETTDPSIPTIITPSETTISVSRARIAALGVPNWRSSRSPSRSPTSSMNLKLPVVSAAAT